MATKLLLIEDVEDLGRSGDVVSVKEGYSRNYLIPRGMAVKADKNALRRQEVLQQERLKQAVQDKKDAELLSEKLATLEIHAVVKTDPDGNLYGSVTAQDLIHLVEEQHKITLEKRYFLLKSPIKKLGPVTLELKLKEEVPATLKLIVSSDDATVEAAAIEEAKSADASIIGDLSSNEAEEQSEE